MATSLQNRVRRLKLRKTDSEKGITRIAKTSLSKAEGRFDSAQDAKDYISESMTAVDAEYTKKTFEESERVQNQISEVCVTNLIDVSFRNQGSVTNDTHIKFFSDIDLIVLTEQFIVLKSPLQATNPYKGEPLQDLQNLRRLIEDRLTTSFYEAKVDKTGKKAVRISGGSLKREIDVISANWYDTQEYRKSNNEEHLRGIQVLDLDGPTRVLNFPFLHNREIAAKDSSTGGSLRRLIRFVKSVKYDTDAKIKVSSYDIASLCYNIETSNLLNNRLNDLQLGIEFLHFSEKLVNDQSLRLNLFVPNKTRPIFGNNGVDLKELKLLNDEIATVLIQASSAGGIR